MAEEKLLSELSLGELLDRLVALVEGENISKTWTRAEKVAFVSLNVRQVDPAITEEMVARAFARHYDEDEEDALTELFSLPNPDPYRYGVG